MKQKEICHVCKKPKEDYIVFMKKDMFSILEHQQAREDGPICERCDSYFAMTGGFKEASDVEFELAKQAAKFARDMLKWWQKDERILVDAITESENEFKNMREWTGTCAIAKWYRAAKQ